MTNQKELDNFAIESLSILEKYGYIKKKEKKNYLIFFLLGIIFIGVIFYGIQTDAFKSIVNQNVGLPETNVYNEYEFATPVQVDNNNTFKPNYTIIVNNLVSCP